MFIIKENKKGFTLTEVIIVLVILGVLALILVPNIKKMMPNDHNIKYKKAFYTIQEIINDIINDPNTCQNADYAASVWTPYNGDNILTTCYDGTTARNLDVEICKRLSTNQTCNDSGENTDILTTDGMRWNLPGKSLVDTSHNDWTSDNIIYVDVDGGTGTLDNSGINKDGIYKITISANGKVFSGTSSANKSDGKYTEAEDRLLMENPTD